MLFALEVGIRLAGLGAVFAVCGVLVLGGALLSLWRRKGGAFATQAAFAVFLFLLAYLFRTR